MEGSAHSGLLTSPHDEPVLRSTRVHVVNNIVLVCNICLAPPTTDPVLTVCGHLFCWPCLYEWLHQAQPKRTCPLCRIELREDISITPVYGSPEIIESAPGPSTTTTSSAAAAAAAAAAEGGAEHEGSGAAMIPAGTVMMIPKRPAPPFGNSRLESLENLNDSGPDSSRFVLRSVALQEVEDWKEECERLQALLEIYKGRLHALERQNLFNRGDHRRVGRDHEERGSRSV